MQTVFLITLPSGSTKKKSCVMDSLESLKTFLRTDPEISYDEATLLLQYHHPSFNTLVDVSSIEDVAVGGNKLYIKQKQNVGASTSSSSAAPASSAQDKSIPQLARDLAISASNSLDSANLELNNKIANGTATPLDFAKAQQQQQQAQMKLQAAQMAANMYFGAISSITKRM